MDSLTLKKSTTCVGTVSKLPASKSYSNRVLILDALAGGTSKIDNLSEANDTVLMNRLLRSDDAILNAEDAGTTMRFLTAWLALQPGTKTLTGSARMKQRPIGILTEALKKLGATIQHTENEGFPPIKIIGLTHQKTNQLSIRGDVSSQYISALMMIAPALPEGLTLSFTGKVGSLPYLEMTAALMRKFGGEVTLDASGATIKARPYHPTEITVEPDWSGASYWYAFAALAEKADLLLPRLSLKSLQGDRVTADIMEHLGVKSEEIKEGVRLTKSSDKSEIKWDFTHCPDLAQTVAVVCTAKGIKGIFTGLESLRIKETDRIAALQTELGKIGGKLEESNGTWTLIPSSALPEKVPIHTYDDHRMAMAFAPLATKMEVTIENPSVVKKSYPRFWEDVSTIQAPL